MDFELIDGLSEEDILNLYELEIYEDGVQMGYCHWQLSAVAGRCGYNSTSWAFGGSECGGCGDRLYTNDLCISKLSGASSSTGTYFSEQCYCHTTHTQSTWYQCSF